MPANYYNQLFTSRRDAIQEALRQASPFSAYDALVFFDPVEKAYFVTSAYELIWPERVHPDRRAWLEERLDRSREVWDSAGKPLF